jgi:hypothetical protein
MLETAGAPGAGPARDAPQDQAAGLRKLFGPRDLPLLPILLATGREASHGTWLSRFARSCVGQGDRTVIVDAARTQVATVFGLRLRFDLQHAFDGDCVPEAACVRAADNLYILPAARAFDQVAQAPDGVQRFERGVRALAAQADRVLLVLPAAQRQVLSALAGAAGYPDVVVVVGAGAQAASRCLDMMGTVRGAADIDAFRLLFQDMDAASAGRLFPRLAAFAERELGARVVDGGRVTDPMAVGRLVREVRCRLAAGGAQPECDRHGVAVEIGS